MSKSEFRTTAGKVLTLVEVVFVGVTASPVAMAYVGPGAGISVLGTLLSVVVVLFLGIIGLVLWPLRVLQQRWKAKAGAAAEQRAAGAPQKSEELEENTVPSAQGQRKNPS